MERRIKGAIDEHGFRLEAVKENGETTLYSRRRNIVSAERFRYKKRKGRYPDNTDQ